MVQMKLSGNYQGIKGGRGPYYSEKFSSQIIAKKLIMDVDE